MPAAARQWFLALYARLRSKRCARAECVWRKKALGRSAQRFVDEASKSNSKTHRVGPGQVLKLSVLPLVQGRSYRDFCSHVCRGRADLKRHLRAWSSSRHAPSPSISPMP